MRNKLLLQTTELLLGLYHCEGFSGGSVVKNLPANAGVACSIPGLGRSPRKRNGNLLEHSCLGSHTDRGAWQAIVHGVTKASDTTW